MLNRWSIGDASASSRTETKLMDIAGTVGMIRRYEAAMGKEPKATYRVIAVKEGGFAVEVITRAPSLTLNLVSRRRMRPGLGSKPSRSGIQTEPLPRNGRRPWQRFVDRVGQTILLGLLGQPDPRLGHSD